MSKRIPYTEWLRSVKAILIVEFGCKQDIKLSNHWQFLYNEGYHPLTALRIDMDYNFKVRSWVKIEKMKLSLPLNKH